MIGHEQKTGFTFGLALMIAMPNFGASQTFEEDVSRKEYWCSLAKSSVSYEGVDRYSEIEDDERKPTVVTVPLTFRDGVIHESFSEDGRFFTYMRHYSDQDDKKVLHGVFDLQLERLSTSSSYLDFGKDGVMRPVSGSYAWSCTKKQ